MTLKNFLIWFFDQILFKFKLLRCWKHFFFLKFVIYSFDLSFYQNPCGFSKWSLDVPFQWKVMFFLQEWMFYVQEMLPFLVNFWMIIDGNWNLSLFLQKKKKKKKKLFVDLFKNIGQWKEKFQVHNNNRCNEVKNANQKEIQGDGKQKFFIINLKLNLIWFWFDFKIIWMLNRIDFFCLLDFSKKKVKKKKENLFVKIMTAGTLRLKKQLHLFVVNNLLISLSANFHFFSFFKTKGFGFWIILLSNLWK